VYHAWDHDKCILSFNRRPEGIRKLGSLGADEDRIKMGVKKYGMRM
jgi:hypothetical protein